MFFMPATKTQLNEVHVQLTKKIETECFGAFSQKYVNFERTNQ